MDDWECRGKRFVVTFAHGYTQVAQSSGTPIISIEQQCVLKMCTQLRNRENGFSFFPGSRPGGRHTSHVGTTPLHFRNVLPRQVFRGQIPDCCGPTISKPGQFLRLPAFLRSTVTVVQSVSQGFICDKFKELYADRANACGPSLLRDFAGMMPVL